MSEGPNSVYTDGTTLRRRFLELDLMAEIKSGELMPVIERSAMANPSRGQPLGILTQVVSYYRGETKIVTVHQYLLPDGTIGASGLPDPKWLRDGDTILKYRAERGPC